MGRRPRHSAVFALQLQRQAGAPLFRQLYDGLRDAILSGRMPAGTRLPSTRLLAAELELSRNTVATAFEQLLIEGYLEGRPGSGTYVAGQLPERLLQATPSGRRPRQPRSRQAPRLSEAGTHLASSRVEAGLAHSEPVPFCPALPALDAFPFEIWSRLVNRRWKQYGRALLGYGDLAGYKPLREAIAQYVSLARAVRCQPQQVVVVAGAQQGLDLAARLLLDAGDSVWLEDPGYLGARAAMRGARAQVVGVAVDEQGLDVAAAVAKCPHARLACVAPSHQYPLGVTMSLPRRLALLDWAYQNGSWILEDDYDSEYRYSSRPLASLQGLDGEGHVIYLGTFSKVLFPALRLGYLIVPPSLVDAFVQARAISDRHPPVLEQAVLTDFIVEGHFASHLRRMRELYQERMEVLVAAAARDLAGVLDVPRVDAGMHAVGWFQDGRDDEDASRRAAERGMEAISLSAYRLTPSRRGGLVLGFACLPPATLRHAVKKLAAILGR